MAISVAFFDSLQALQLYIDKAISETKTLLGVTLAKTEEVRKKYNATRASIDSSKSVSGRMKTTSSNTKQQEVAGFRVLFNPSADYELKLMEESATSLQEKIDVFEKAKSLYPSLTIRGTKVAMVLDEGVPGGFMFYVPDAQK